MKTDAILDTYYLSEINRGDVVCISLGKLSIAYMVMRVIIVFIFIGILYYMAYVMQYSAMHCRNPVASIILLYSLPSCLLLILFASIIRDEGRYSKDIVWDSSSHTIKRISIYGLNNVTGILDSQSEVVLYKSGSTRRLSVYPKGVADKILFTVSSNNKNDILLEFCKRLEGNGVNIKYEQGSRYE